MIGQALRGYLDLANGLTQAPRAQAAALAEDLLRTSRANRAALSALIRQEVDRGLARAGLASAEALDVLDRRLRAVERQLAATKRAAAK